MHHNNAFEKDTVAAGIAKHYADPAKLSLDEYLVYAGQTQAMMYGYSLESMRCCPTTYGSLFWMYADCWGEVGWTIVDYYLKRKPAFYAVMRTFAPVKIALRSDGRRVHCHGFNDTAAEIGIPVRYGSIGLDGRGERSEKATLVLPARSRKEVLVFDLPKTDSQKELVFVGPEACFAGNVKPGSGSPSGSGPASKADYASGSASGDIVLPAVLRQAEFRRLAATTPKFDVSEPKEIPGGIEITIRSIQWAHGVHFDLPVDAVPSDCWFDMLPGETRRIQLRGLTPAQGRKLRIEAVKGKA
jgi:beta-mannosidase